MKIGSEPSTVKKSEIGSAEKQLKKKMKALLESYGYADCKLINAQNWFKMYDDY